MGFEEKSKMKIDRHNYEEFFILYWDSELTAAQKQAVENFVKENSDLKEEFKILGETRFIADNNVRFEGKEFLLNNSSINITNYEEQLLNYIDDELNSDERKEVERSAAKYPAIQKELSLLQKTKLYPEPAFVFPDKSILYRREEKVRVISMTWFRVAVAAAIILIAGFVTLRLVNADKGGDKIEVVQNDNLNTQPPNQKADQPVIQPEIQAQKDQKETLVTTEKKSSAKQTSGKTNKNAVTENNVSDPLVAYTPENKNNLPKEGNNKNQTSTEPNPAINGIIADVDPTKKEFGLAKKNDSAPVNTAFDKSDVTLKQNLTLYIPEAEEKEKVGLKEFLRKTTRAFERRTKIQTTTEDDKLLVGAFAVSLK